MLGQSWLSLHLGKASMEGKDGERRFRIRIRFLFCIDDTLLGGCECFVAGQEVL